MREGIKSNLDISLKSGLDSTFYTLTDWNIMANCPLCHQKMGMEGSTKLFEVND